MPTFQKASISITCPDPYWKDPQEVTRALKAYDGKFTFPFEFPVEFGIESDSTIIYNKGDTDAPITISIKGPIRRPIVRSEEHTSELQSRFDLVCRLLLEKKNTR